MARRLSLTLLLAALYLSLSVVASAAEPITVFAAASLKNALDEAARAFEESSGDKVAISFAASSVLAKQIEAGAPADLFISADIPWMDYLAERGLIDEKSRVKLLGNDLVLVAPTSSPIGKVDISDKMDLSGMLANGRLAVGQVDSVPAGKYAKAALQNLHMWAEVEPKLAQADNVRAALALVSRSEAPFGIVYASDAASDKNVKVIGTFPNSSHPPIIYPAALITQKPFKPNAGKFLAFLQGSEAAAAFRHAGFMVLKGPAS